MAAARTLFFAGGGTGGHLYPGLAVAESIAARAPDVKIVFLCTTRPLDEQVLRDSPHEFVPQPVVPVRRSVGGLLRFWRAWRATQELVRQLIKERKPAGVLGLGGYAAGAAVRLASDARLPTAILNPDVVPGKANVYLLRHVRKVFAGCDATVEHVPASQRAKVVVTGCPLRHALIEPTDRAEAARRIGLDAPVNTLVVTGASQGAVTVNRAVLATLAAMKDGGKAGGAFMQGWQVLHLAGKENADEVRREYRALGVPAVVLGFTPEMQDVWAVADLAVSRAGASTAAELLARGVPSVLMPYPYHRDQHQLHNARVLEKAGAAVVVEDKRAAKENAARLRPALEALLYDAPRRAAMRAAALSIARPDAADRVADEVLTWGA